MSATASSGVFAGAKTAYQESTSKPDRPVASATVGTSGRIEVRMRVAMVFQKFALMPWLTVRENIGFGLEMQGRPEKERRKLVDEKNPKVIGINVSRTHAFSDGLTAGELEGMSEALGKKWTARYKRSEELPLQLIATRLPEEEAVFGKMTELVQSGQAQIAAWGTGRCGATVRDRRTCTALPGHRGDPDQRHLRRHAVRQ